MLVAGVGVIPGPRSMILDVHYNTMSNRIRPLLSHFEVEIDVAGSSPSRNPQMEMTSGDQLCGARLLSREVQSIKGGGATTVTRVGQETVDDD